MLTIIFATYNGGDTLGQMLRRLCELTPPPVAYEILMVNNGSTDVTVEVAQAFAGNLPLKILHENRRGKNRALNHGLAHAQGELLLFTDDDVLPDKDWLVKAWECAEQHPDVDLFGGRIMPFWQAEPSSEFLGAVPLTAAYGITPAELPEGPVTAGAIWGANMFVRKRLFDRGFRFNENVGPGPGNYLMGSEVDFNQRMASLGYRTWYCPGAIVRHIILEKETTREWLKKRAYKFGKGTFAREWGDIKHGQPTTLWGVQLNFPRWLIRKFISEWLKAFKSRFFGNSSGELKHLWNAYDHLGRMVQGWNSRSS